MLKVTPEARTGRFENELCGCFKDFGVCCTACVCPAVQEAYDFANSREESCGCTHCLCRASPIWTRMNIRLARGMKPNMCEDCASYCFCYYCSICQDAREIKSLQNYHVRSRAVEDPQPPPSPPIIPPQQYNGAYGPPINPAPIPPNSAYYGPPVAPVGYQLYPVPPTPVMAPESPHPALHDPPEELHP